jgi:polyhydroxyalkanoate synthesis regulator phasin
MKLEEAKNFFESLKTETKNKSEIKIYDKFIYVLSKLKSREFSKDEIQSLETELDRLDLESNTETGRKYFKNALSKFEKYLKDTFSLISKGYYIKLGAGLGISFGILFGVVFLSDFERSLGISLGLGIGLLIGLIIGRLRDAKAISEGRVL